MTRQEIQTAIERIEDELDEANHAWAEGDGPSWSHLSERARELHELYLDLAAATA
jgi:hypothetical protein